MSKAALTPFHDNIILEPIAGVKQIGAILVPEAHVRTLNQGKVLDKGPLVTDGIQLGDIVFFGMHTESRMDWRGNSYIVVSEANCLGSIRSLPNAPIETPTYPMPLQSERKIPFMPMRYDKEGRLITTPQFIVADKPAPTEERSSTSDENLKDSKNHHAAD